MLNRRWCSSVIFDTCHTSLRGWCIQARWTRYKRAAKRMCIGRCEGGSGTRYSPPLLSIHSVPSSMRWYFYSFISIPLMLTSSYLVRISFRFLMCMYSFAITVCFSFAPRPQSHLPTFLHPSLSPHTHTHTHTHVHTYTHTQTNTNTHTHIF